MATSITTVASKGAPLNSTEFDNNLTSLKNACDESANKLVSIENGTLKAGEAVNAENSEKLAGMAPGSGADSILHTDENGNVGVSVTPSGWNSAFKALELDEGCAVFAKNDSNSIRFCHNAYTDASDIWRYKVAGKRAYLVMLYNGGEIHYTASTAANAEDPITWILVQKIDANGNVGIGCNPSRKLDVHNSSTDTIDGTDSLNCQLRLYNDHESSTNGTYSGISFFINSDTNVATSEILAIQPNKNTRDCDLSFRTKENSGVVRERIRINSGADRISLKPDGYDSIDVTSHGLYFHNNSTSTNPTVLDWYEEGTWTPGIYGSSSHGSTSYSAREGYYTRIGNIVTVNLYIVGTWTSAPSGQVRISGLPFMTSSNLHRYDIGSAIIGYMDDKARPYGYKGSYSIAFYSCSGSINANTYPIHFGTQASTSHFSINLTFTYATT